jgi:hypothetical protein
MRKIQRKNKNGEPGMEPNPPEDSMVAANGIEPLTRGL